MNLFTNLNKELGISIVMVTHESDVAAYSDRRIMFKDGLIIDDSPVIKTKNKTKVNKKKH